MEISKSMLLALSALRSASASDAQLAEALGISRSTLSKIFSGELVDVRRATWEKVNRAMQSRTQAHECPYGYSTCPMEGAPEFRALVKMLVDVDDSALYGRLTREVEAWREKHKNKQQ